MVNGRPGDHPLTDILLHGRRVYSPAADALVREIADLDGAEGIADMPLARLGDLNRPAVAELEQALAGIRDRLRREAQERGWET